MTYLIAFAVLFLLIPVSVVVVDYVKLHQHKVSSADTTILDEK